MTYAISRTETGVGELPQERGWSYSPPWIYDRWTPEQTALVAIVHAAVTEPGEGVVGSTSAMWWEHPSPGVVTGVFQYQYWDSELERDVYTLYEFSGTYSPVPAGLTAPAPEVVSIAPLLVDSNTLRDADYGGSVFCHGVLADTSTPPTPPFWQGFVGSVEIP